MLTKKAKIVVKVLRLNQWTKNLLLFAGIVFAKRLFDWPSLEKVIISFLVFCFISSALYIFNDLNDLESDRQHHRKKYRPIASGAISKFGAITILITIGTVALVTAWFLGKGFFLVVIIYTLMIALYTLFLKKLAIIDIMIIAIGFVLRAIAGAVVINVFISPWLLVCTLLLALFLSLIKRRQELSIMENDKSRSVLSLYSIEFFNQAITIITATTLTGYFIYTFSVHSEWLMVTIPFVIYGIFRYLLLTLKQGSGEEPENIILSDIPFLLNLVLWIGTCVIILYLV